MTKRVLAQPATGWSGTNDQIRFCTSSDSVRIAFATCGTGPPVVKAANWLTHIEFDRASPVWRHWIDELSLGHALVRYDKRGCGLSDWDASDFSVDAWETATLWKRPPRRNGCTGTNSLVSFSPQQMPDIRLQAQPFVHFTDRSVAGESIYEG